MANLVPCYAVAGHRGSLRCPGFVRRLVISCDIPRRGDLDGFFRIRVLTRVILVVLQACFHMSKSNSAPQTAGLFATLVFGFVVLGFLARNSQKGTPVFRRLGCI